MLRVKRGNHTATIKPSEIAEFSRNGWSVISDEKLYNVFKVVDGELSKSPSMRGMNEEDALAWMDGRDYEYQLVSVE